MTLLFWDTETSKLPLWKQPSSAPDQPHIVQLTALLTDNAGRKISSIDLITKAEGWEIDPEAAKASHGISTEFSAEHGVTETLAVTTFLHLWHLADLAIAHNKAFDERIIRIALHRFPNIMDPDLFKEGESFCTQVKGTPHTKLPPTGKMMAAGRKHFKPPTLGEAYKWATGNDLFGAHNAMRDVMALRSVFFAILEADPSIYPQIPRGVFKTELGGASAAHGTIGSVAAKTTAPETRPDPAPPGTFATGSAPTPDATDDVKDLMG